MSEVQGRIIRKRNPGVLQSDDEVREQFVVREKELAIALEILRGNIDADSCQHALIVAPRGRGKTMLLARIATELRGDSELAAHLLPVRFMEESDEIFSAADFWLEVLFYLANAIEEQDHGLARTVRATRDDLTARWRERELDERARVAVLEASYALGRRLVLMVENLQALCANVDDDFGWNLRKTLQTEPQIILLATATSRFEGLDDAREPFFELFRIISLAPLNAEQCGRLWKVVSGESATEHQQRALEVLTGGSPRYVVIVGGFARHRSLRQLMEELVQLIDDLTDTFRGYQEVLPRIERRVFLATADLWQASSTGEIADHARMDIRTVSTMLGRLVKRHAVRQHGSGRKRLYEVAEPLYSIYYQLRRQRDEAAVVQNLLRFMAGHYREERIAELFGSLKLEALQSPSILAGIERAESELPRLSELTEDFARAAQTLVNTAVEKIGLADYEGAISVCDNVLKKFGASKGPSLQVQAMKACINKGVAQGRGGNSVLEIETNREAVNRFGLSEFTELQHQLILSLFNIGSAQVRLGEYNAAIATYQEILRRFGTARDAEIAVQVARSLVNKGWVHGRLGDFGTEVAVCRDVIARFGQSEVPELQIEVATAWFNAGVALARSGKHPAAIRLCDDLVARFGRSSLPCIHSRVAKALINKGVELVELGEYAAAITTFGSASERYAASDDAEVRACVAQSLGYKAATEARIGNTDAAMLTAEQVVARFAKSDEPGMQLHVAGALIQKSACLGGLGRHLEAISVTDEIVARYGANDDPEIQVCVARALNNKCAAYALLGDTTATIETCEAVVGRYRTTDVSDVQIQVAVALYYKGIAQVKNGLSAEALQTSEELDRRRRTVAEGVRPTFKWRATYVRMSALLVQQNHTEAVAAFCSLYSVFAPENELTIPELVEAVALLVNGGVPELEIIGIIQSDPSKASRVAPLVIALRQCNGEVVRAPTEILKVAADVRKRIEETEPLPAFTTHQ